MSTFTLPKNAIDITGQRFGRLVAIAPVEHQKGKGVRWLLICDCGGKVNHWAGAIRSSKGSRSCGCLRHEPTAKTHGLTGTKEYRSWYHMKSRCLNSNDKWFHKYGGRGITVCRRWINSFERFLQDMGNAPSLKHSLDRIDNDGHYEPGNCRWATQQEQVDNSTHVRKLTINGVTKTRKQWVDICGANYWTVRSRLDRNVHPVIALLMPSGVRTK